MAYFRDLIGNKPRPKFWVKTFLHLVAPGGFGYIRALRAGRDASYVHERDKHEVRHKHHGGGGWKALTWDESAARTKADNIRTWGQLGLTGAWADKRIRVYGPPNLGAGTITEFQSKVMGGGAIFNEELREYADRARMVTDLAADPYGIAYTALGDGTAGVKPVAVGETAAGPYLLPTRGSVASRAYPLARPVYIYYTIDNEKTEIANPRVDPKVREFLRYVLSKQGQQAVAQEGHYLPLTPAVVGEQLKTLAFDGVPPERKLLKAD